MAAVGNPEDRTIAETVSRSREHGRIAALRRAAAAHRSSALLLRASGRETAACRAERAARRIGLALDRQDATDGMLLAARSVRETADGDLRRERALEEAIQLLGADRGNIQLVDRRTGALAIVTHAGFNENFLEHFANGQVEGSACGRAAGGRSQVVIPDVDADLGFQPHRRIAADSRFRAVQSTPLLGADGAVVAVFSTHFRRPHRPTEAELVLFEWYVEQVGTSVAAAA